MQKNIKKYKILYKDYKKNAKNKKSILKLKNYAFKMVKYVNYNKSNNLGEKISWCRDRNAYFYRLKIETINYILKRRKK